MRIAVLGTGMVGAALATRLVQVGHDVMMGSRSAPNDKAQAWLAQQTGSASAGTFAEAAAHGEVVVNATGGSVSLQALEMAGSENLAGKVLIDVANPMKPDSGFPPVLEPVSTDSLAESIQRAFPAARVVKALNTMNCDVMVNPSLVAGEHDVFLAGDDESAKAVVRGLLTEFGWPPSSVRDLGAIVAARGLEMYLIYWLGLRMAIGHNRFNVHVAGADV